MCRQWWGSLRRIVGAVLLALFLGAAPTYAQVELGENVKMTMNGTLGTGYGGSLGNSFAGSTHNLFISGSGTLNGSYYNPNFLSFTVQPFYNRNQDNSSFQSVFSDTGVNASVNFFGGSHFPGSVSYGRSLTSGSQYGLPGEIGLDSNGSNRTFTISWSELIPDYPSLTATFSDTSTSDTILGETGTIDSGVRSFGLFSTYRVAGFGLTGQFSHQSFNTIFPAFLTGSSLESNSSSTSYGISATHALPLSGALSAGFNRSSYSSDAANVSNTGASDTLYATASLRPTQKLGVNGTFRYYDNLMGAFQANTFGNGGLPLTPTDLGAKGVSLNGFASYSIGHGFQLSAYLNQQMQHYRDVDLSNTQYGATLTYGYARPLLGMLYFTFGMVNTANNPNQGNLAFVGSLGLKKQIRRWELNADVSYAQNVQSSIALYTTSNYNFGAYVRKRFGTNTYFTASARNASTGLTQIAGYGNRSETFLATLTRRRYGMSASYSMSHGTSVLTSTGALTPTPLAPLISPTEVLYNGRAYGFGFNVVPVRKMVVNINWYRTQSDTQSATVFSNNNSERLYGTMSYNLRKLQFRATYWRVNQMISASGLPVANQNSYSFTVSRWFNVF